MELPACCDSVMVKVQGDKLQGRIYPKFWI